jgi:beta-lactam-binding protein with PASTA domain
MLIGFAIAMAFMTVPDVERVPRSEAQCAIVDAGLRWRDNDGRRRSYSRAPVCAPNEAVAPDPTVLRQRPAAGARVPRGTTVVLTDNCTRRRPCK